MLANVVPANLLQETKILRSEDHAVPKDETLRDNLKYLTNDFGDLRPGVFSSSFGCPAGHQSLTAGVGSEIHGGEFRIS